MRSGSLVRCPLATALAAVYLGSLLTCCSIHVYAQNPPSGRPLLRVGPNDALEPSAYTFDVTNSGEAVWDMPIWVPQGRNGVAPSLSFSYRSRRESGLMGQGFNISGLSAIARCWRTAAQDGGFEPGPTVGLPDVFCLDGQRLVPHGTTPGELQPELDPSILVRVNGPADAPQSFDVFHPSGQVWRYGSRQDCAVSSLSQVKGKPVVVSAPTDAQGLFTSDDFTEAAGASDRVIAWNLDRVEDRWGNYYEIDYLRRQFEDWAFEVAPASITWTGFGAPACSTQPSLTPSRRIEFFYAKSPLGGDYTSRQDPRTAYRAGLEIRQTLLLNKVVVLGPDALVSSQEAAGAPRAFREYRLAYKSVPPGMRVVDRLESITECVYNTLDDVQCMEPISFSWTPDNPLVPEFLASKDPVQAQKDDPSLNVDLLFDSTTGVEDAAASMLDSVVADFDGDGRDDYLYRLLWFVTPSSLPLLPGTGIGQWYLRLGTPAGLGPRHLVQGLPNTHGGDPRFSPRAIDIDGDGRAEVLLYSEDALVQEIFRGDPSLNQYHVTDNIGYELFSLAPHGCTMPSSTDCEFQARNLGETKTYHPLELVPRNSIAVQIGDLDGDGRLDLTRDDTDCPFPLSCSVGEVGTAHDIGIGFRKGATAGPAGFAPPVTVQRAFPAVGPFTNVTFRQFEGRYLVDTDGNGQPELVTDTYDSVPTETSPSGLGQFPFSLSSLFFTPNGGQVRNVPIPLGDRPLAMSPMMFRLRGPCFSDSLVGFSRIFLDVNGDGLDDSVAFSDTGKDPCNDATNTTFLALNAGGTFRKAQPLSIGAIAAGPKLNELFTPARGYDSGARVADLDGDRRTDIVYFSEAGVFWLKSTGDGFQSFPLPIAGTNGTQLVPGTTIQYKDASGNPSGFGPRLSRLGDFNGDGVLDIVTVREKHVPGGPAFSYLEVNLGAPRNPDMVNGVSGGHLRPALSVDYGFASIALPGDLYKVNGSRVWPQTILSKPGWVVKDYSVEAGDLDAPTPVVNVYRYQYDTARTDLTGRGFLGVDRRTRQLTDDAPTPMVFETETLDYELHTFERVCRSDVMCTYPYIGEPIAGVNVVPIDNSRYYVKAWRTSRTVQARPGATAGYDLATSGTLEDTCETIAFPSSPAAPCAAADALISSARQSREFDGFGNTVRLLREISNGSSLMTLPDPPVFSEELRATPDPLSVADAARWLTSRYGTWDYASFDPTLPAGEQTITRRITKAYEPNSVELTRLTLEAPPLARPETDTTSGFAHTTIFSRANWGAVTTIEERASGTVRTTSVGFASGDPDMIFPTTFTNTLGHVTTVWPHATLGVAFAADDANGVRTEWDYDVLGRARAVRRQGGGAETFTYQNDLRADGSLSRTWTFAHRGPAIADQTATYDALGRMVGSQREEVGATAARSFTFDRFGLPLKAGYPVDAAQTQVSKMFVEFERDGLGRATKMTRPGENAAAAPFVSRFSYMGRKATSESERKIISNVLRDAKGRVARIETLDHGRPIGTDMEYWHFDLLRHVTHPTLPADQIMNPPPAQQPSTVITYDVLGRRETITDPDIGYETYRYNGYGELKRVEDANGGVTTFDPDGLGRAQRTRTLANAAYPPRQAQGQWAQDTQFTYDTAAFGIGKLARVASADGIVKTFEYDLSSRLQSVKTTDETGQEWPIGYEYNSDGLTFAINYPGAGANPPFRVEYKYSQNGDIESIFDASSGPRSLLWRQVSTNLNGQSTEERFGTTETVERVYDDSFDLRLQSGRFGSNSKPFQKISYQWGADGLLMTKVDLSAGISETYGHDALQRLWTWDVKQGGHETKWQYDYDDWGNMRQRHVVSGVPFASTTYEYTTPADTSRPHTLKRTTTGATAPADYTYLAGGQLSQGEGAAYTWTPFGLPASITNTAVSSALLYDGLRQRVVRKDGGAAGARHVTVDGLFELHSMARGEAEFTYNVANEDGVIAQIRSTKRRSSKTVRFFHADHLGNPDATTTASRNTNGKGVGQLIERGKYEPFGELRSPAALARPIARKHESLSDPGFTGQQPDDAFGLVNMRGRLYQPKTGRFISPDPIASIQSQALNRYSYVRNSPVMHVDPTGYEDDPPAPPAAVDFTSSDWLMSSLASAQAASYAMYGPPIPTISQALPPASDEGSGAVAGNQAQPTAGGNSDAEPTPGGGIWSQFRSELSAMPARFVRELDALNDRAEAMVNALAHGAILESLEIGGKGARTIGITSTDEYEESILKYRLSGLQYDSRLVELGETALEQYLGSKLPGPERPYRGPSVEYLDGLSPSRLKALRTSSEIGQEAHRQIARDKYPTWEPEVTLELIPGVIVRKDAIRLTNIGAEVLIIKPNTPTGQISAARRAQLVKDAGYKPKVELYDPTNPAYLPDSPTYIGPGHQ